MLYPGPYRRPKVALTVVDIDAAWAELVERGVPVIGPIIDTGATRLFFILDPDGTLIQLHAVDLAVERAGALGVIGLRPNAENRISVPVTPGTPGRGTTASDVVDGLSGGAASSSSLPQAASTARSTSSRGKPRGCRGRCLPSVGCRNAVNGGARADPTSAQGMAVGLPGTGGSR